MSSNAIQESAKMRPREPDQFSLESDAEAARPAKPSKLRKPQFGLVPSKTYEEQVKTLKQTIEGLEIQNSQLKALRHEDLEKYEQLSIYTDNLRKEKSLLQVKIEAADAQHSCTLKKLHELEMEVEDTRQQKSDIQGKLNDVQEQLKSAKRTASSYDDLISEHETLKTAFSEALRHALEAKGDVENQAKNVQLQAELVKVLTEKLTASEAKAAQHQAELEAIKETLKEKLAEAEAKQDYIVGITSQIGAKEAALAEQESALYSLKVEHQQLLEQMQGLLASSNDKIQDLEAKCEQQAVDLDNLKQEKINLQSDVNEAHLQHLCTKNKLQKLEKEMEALISELDEALQSSKLNAVSHGDLVARHQELIASSNGQIQELQEKCEQQLQDMDILRQEMSVLRVQIKEADAQHSSTVKKLHELEVEVKDKSQQKSNLQEKLETITGKMYDVQEQLESAKRKARSYENMISEHEKFKAFFSEATGVSSKLQEKVHSLQSQLLASRQEVSNRDLEIKVVRLELRHALEAKDTASAEQLALAKQLQALEETMSSRGEKFQKEVADLNGSVIELQLKLTSLQERKDAVESDNKELKEKLTYAHNLQTQLGKEQKACVSLRANLVELQEANTRLEEQLRAKEAELNHKCSEMGQKVELGRHSIGELTKECDTLRCELETKTTSWQTEKESQNKECDKLKCKEICFLTERERLNATISSLLEDKRNLQEKTCTLAEIITKMEAELALKISGSNSSFGSNAAAAASTSSKGLATGSGNHDRHAASSGVKKSTHLDIAMRKGRRITAQDERRQISIWNTSRDFGTMTDPDSLSEKLQAESEQLKSQLLEEQHRGKRLRQKIRDLTAKFGNPLD